MNNERMLRLADYMERVNPANYNQDSWVDGVSNAGASRVAASEFDKGQIIIPEGTCGTTMCVMGHAVAAVPDAGFWFRADFVSRDTPVTWATIRWRHPETGEIYEAFEAAEHAFDLLEGHANVIFGGSDELLTYEFYTGQRLDYESDEDDFHERVTPQTVAAKLREYVASGGATVEDLLQREYDEEMADA